MTTDPFAQFEKFGNPFEQKKVISSSNKANSTDPFAQFEDAGNPFGESQIHDRTLLRSIGDVGVSLAHGVVGAGEAAVGLANIPTLGYAGKGLEAIGYDPKGLHKIISSGYSEAQKAANEEVENAEGFVDTVSTMIKNPSTIGHTAIESIPSMVGGGLIGRGVLKAGTKYIPKAVEALGKYAPIVASALGEGVIGAGSAAEQIRQETETGTLTGKQSALAIASGLGTGAFGLAGGALAKKLGFADLDTMLVSGKFKKDSKSIIKSIIGGGISEGIFEELPQSIQEQIFANAALDKPLMEGVGKAAATGMLAGIAMGGTANIIATRNNQKEISKKEKELNKQIDKIFSLDKDKVNIILQELQESIAKNSALLNNQAALDKYAIDANIDPDTLIAQFVNENNINDFLIQGIQKRLTDQQAAKEKELANISPEQRQVLNIQNKIKEQREEAAININEQIDEINNQLSTLRQQAAQEQDPEKRSLLYENVFELIDSRDALLDRQKEQPVIEGDFAEPKKADEIRQEKETFYNQLWPGGVNKDAAKSAEVFNTLATEQQEILNRITTQINNEQDQQKKNDLQKLYDGLFQNFERDASESAEVFQTQDLSQINQIVKAKDYERLNKILEDIIIEPDPQTRQTFYEQLFMQPRIKDAAESAEVFASLTPEEHDAYIEKAKSQARKDLTNEVNEIIGEDSASAFTNERQVENDAETDRIAKELDDFFNDFLDEETSQKIIDSQNTVDSTIDNPPITYTAKPGESIEEVNLNQNKLNNYAKKLKAAYTAGNLEIPQYMIALDLLARKDITALEQILDALAPGQNNENDPAYAKTSSFQAKGKADLKRLINLLGSQMYKGNLAEITIKEVVQNSFDAVKASLADKSLKGIKDGRIDITVDSINRIIAIKDNGQGMSKKILLDAFLTIAGTDKSGLSAGDASGGFGMAKAAFLYGNEWISVNTVKNGKRYKFTAYGDEIISKAINIIEETADKNEHGTVIVIKVPEKIDVNGEQKYVWFPNDVKEITFFKQPLLHDSIGFYLQDKYLPAESIEELNDPNNPIWHPDNFSTINTGKNFDLSKYNKNTTVHFDWGSADLYIANDRNSSTWDTQHSILSAGVFQFNFDFNMGRFEKIPYNIILNVFPTSEASSATYPFNVRREGWKDTIEKDIKSLTQYVKNVALGIDAQQTVEQFKNIKTLPKIDIHDIGTNSVDITNFLIDLNKKKLVDDEKEIPATIVSTPKITIDDGKVIAIDDTGEETLLIDNNEKEAEKIQGSFSAEKEAPKAKDFLIDVGIDDSQPILHNNTNVDFLSLANENGYSGEVLFAELGSLMLKVRDFIADKTIYGFDALKDKDKSVFVGISIDKQYHGVNLVVPFQAALLNPLAIKSKTLPGLVHGYYDTIIHEFTHIKERNHNESFISAQSELKTLLASDGTDIEIRVTLGRMLKKHQNLLNLLRTEYEKSSTKNVAKSLEGASERNAQNANGIENVTNGNIANGNAEWSRTINATGGQADSSGISTGFEDTSRDVNFQTTEQEKIGNIDFDSIKKAFPNQEITKAEDGTISIQFKNGKGLTIKSIQQADQDFIKLAIDTGQMSERGKILGITIGNEILLNENFADNKTLWHENKHVLDNLGLITSEDDAALNREFNKLRKANKLEFALSTHKDPKQAMIENRANMFAQIMVDREAYRNKPLGKVIQRVIDFFDKLFAMGKQTVGGLAREIESGKVYERQEGENATPEQIAKSINPSIIYDGKIAGIPGVVDDLHNFTVTLPDGKQPSFSVPGEVTQEKLVEQLNKTLEKFSAAQPMFNSKELKPVTQKMVNSLAFKDWFGDSKVKSIVYHGSPTFGQNDNFTFEQRDVNKTQSPFAGLGYFFAENKNEAAGYAGIDGKINETFLRIENPLTVSSWELPVFGSRAEAKDFQMQKKLQGYDGIYLEDENHWIAFDENQIKSAETNTGEFSRLNNDIRFQVDEETGQKISDEIYHQMFTERNNLVRKIGQTLRMRGTEFKQLLDKGFGAISTRLKNVDPILAAEIRNLDFRTSQKIVTALRIAHPLLKATKKMSPEDKFIWDTARRNSDEGKIKQIAEKYGITQDQENLRNVLNQIRQDAIDVGYDVGFIDEYWPRIIKDTEGFLQATKGISNQPVFTNALKAQADKLGLSVEKFQVEYPEVAADIISNTILGRNLGIGGPGNIQSRQYETVPPELNKYYMDSDAALMQYIYSMTKKIEVRRFFGNVPERIKRLKADKKRKDRQILSYNEELKNISPEERVEFNKRINDISGDLIRIEQELDKYKLQRDYTENIGAYIDDLILNKRITKDEERLVRNILDARFHEHGTTGLINAYKNMAYIDVMGSPISALTQIGDLAWAMYVGKVWTPRGLSSTVKNLGKAISKNSEITKEDLGIERIAQEFADGTTLGNAVSWVFKKVQLERIDSIGKEVLINNALDNYRAMIQTEAGRTELHKYLKPIFGTQSDSVIQDLLADNPSDNVKMLLYHRLLDFQPVALSEMPEQYLKSGNGRIFYMLKTYTIKQFDVFRNEAWHKIKTGERDQVIEGIGNMVKLVSLLALANAGADELKDFLLGKDTDFKDHVIENFITMGGASKYVKMQISREGLGSGLIGQVLPPFKFIDSISKDALELHDQHVAGDVIDLTQSRTIESIPLGGKLYYWHYGRGEDYKKSLGEQNFKDIGKDIRMFKRQLENAENKREFIYANMNKFKQMKLYENFQSSLSRNQSVINKLKDIEQTTNVIERLGKLKAQRELLLEKYFEASERLK
jgi:hypothetical protein